MEKIPESSSSVSATTKSKKPKVKKAKKADVYVDPKSSVDGEVRVGKAKHAPNLDLLYKAAGAISVMERDLKSVRDRYAQLNQTRAGVKMELDLLQVHINRVAREVDHLRRFEDQVHREASAKLVATSRSSEDLMSTLEEDDPVKPLMEDMQVLAEKELKAALLLLVPAQEVQKFFTTLDALRSLGIKSLPPLRDPSELNDTLQEAKSACLSRLVEWESKLARRYDNSRPL